MSLRNMNGYMGSFNHETLSVVGASTPLTRASYVVADTGNPGKQVEQKVGRYAFITVETDQVRYWLDGTAPTATAGHLLNVGDVLELWGTDELVKVRFIRVTSSATLQVSYA